MQVEFAEQCAPGQNEKDNNTDVPGVSMNFREIDALPIIFDVVGTLAVILVVWFSFRLLNRRLLSHYEGRTNLVFRRQLFQLGGILTAILVGILLLPSLSSETRGQLLSLFGIIVSATIALSSTTLVGNVMAGIMLRTIASFKPGDYITVGDYFGRISEMDLLHVEIQTEERDLTTLPNLYLVTHPVRVMHTSGTLLSVEVSLGYDVSRHQVETLLKGAATESELENPYVQIRQLGDYSVTYAISALLTKVNKVIAKRRELRARTMDALHEAGIEIVSPTFMNTRAYKPDDAVIPEVDPNARDEVGTAPDSLVFDKAEKAESVARLREMLDEAQAKHKEAVDNASKLPKDGGRDKAVANAEEHGRRVERLKAVIERRESDMQSK